MERFNWTLYPEAKQKLDESGLTRRIEKAARNDKIIRLGFISERNVVDYIMEMDKDKLFDSIPVGERRNFKKTLSDAWTNRDNLYWSVKRNGEDSKERIADEDFLLLSGFRSVDVLRKDELFDYKKFGFSSIFEFTGTTGAAIEMASGKDIDREGLRWEKLRPDGRVITSTITGDINADLRIYQKDITAYQTVDPLGNKVYYRPEMGADKMTVSAYHSTEAATLVSFLKYVDQIGIKPKTLENGAVDTINWAKALGQGGGSCAEHFGGFDRSPFLFFSTWSIPIPQLDERYQTKEHCIYSIGTQVEGRYNFYIEPKKALVISYEDESKKGAVNVRKSVSFLPDEMDDAIKALLYQAAIGLGRTSVRQLIDILEYRFSPNFDKDLHKFR